MKSYIKIYGPPVFKAIKTLEKMAIDMSEVCIMDTIIENQFTEPDALSGEDLAAGSERSYFGEDVEIPQKRCGKVISKSGEALGDNDFYFEWFAKPNQEQVNDLINRIDEALTPLGCRYTIVTK